MTDRPLRLTRAHAVPGRLRLRAAGQLERGALAALVDRIAAVEGVAGVVARPNTGSLILTLRDSAEAVEDRLQVLGIARIGPPAQPPPLGQVVQFGMLKLDGDIRRQSEGALDLKSTIALALAAGAVLQLARGRIAGPATTLAMAAFGLLDPGRGRAP